MTTFSLPNGPKPKGKIDFKKSIRNERFNNLAFQILQHGARVRAARKAAMQPLPPAPRIVTDEQNKTD